ncbi:MAG TPA: NUDIX hydrolase [Candidatus Nanoarchaeia archaeon]|nr:NUDIX hydrolase [Candidatus Nanoarchaeia archaeon]
MIQKKEMKKTACIILYDKNKNIFLQQQANDGQDNSSRWTFIEDEIQENEIPIHSIKRICQEKLNYELNNQVFIEKIQAKDREIYCYSEEFRFSKKIILNDGKGYGWFSYNEAQNLKLTPGTFQILTIIKDKI